MARQNGFGVRPGARISAQQIVLIAVSVLAVVLMVTTLIAFGRASNMAQEVSAGREALMTQYGNELNAIGLLMDRQAGESGEARINTLYEAKQHIYAADAFSIYNSSAYGAEAMMTTDQYSALMNSIDQSIQQLRSGNRPDEQTAAAIAALDELRQRAAGE